MSEAGDESLRVIMARMEGKLDLSNLRHDQTDAWKQTVDTRLHTHSNRIQNIEAREHQRDGERKGVALGGRALWALVVLIPGATAAVVALLNYLGR